MSGSQSPPTADAAAAARFLAAEHVGGDVHLNAIQRSGAAAGKLIGITIAASDEAAISAWVEKQAQEGRCAYWMPNRPLDGQRQSAKRARFKEDEITTVRWAYLDVDPVGAEAPTDVVARVVAKLRTFTLPPTWFICTGRGVQLLWRLKPADDAHALGLGVDLRVDGDVERRRAAREINFGLIAAFGGKAAGVDNCYSLEHLFRVPGSLHQKCKDGSPPLPCFIVHEHSHPEVSYEPGEFLRVPLPTEKGARAVAPPAGTASRMRDVDVKELQAWAAANGKVIPDHPLAVLAHGQDFDRTRYPSRSEALFAVLTGLVRASVPDEMIMAAVTTAFNKASACVLDKRDPLGEAARQLANAHGAVASEGEQPDTVLDEMNRLHAVVTEGRVRVLSLRRTNPTIDRLAPDLQSFEDFRNRYRHQSIAVGSDAKGNTVYKKKGDWWLDNPGRRQILGLCFAPGEAADVGGFQNLWLGFGIEPAPGDWSLMRAHIIDVLAQGNPEHADYIIKWVAWAVQNPDKQAEAALVFRGPQGTGKGIFGRTVKELFGQHGLHIKSAKHLTGDFNLHLRDCCLLFADEAIAPGDKGAESRLKGLITEPDLTIEGKGENLVTEPNHLHVVMASNEDWVVPAAADERRYAVFNVAGNHQQERGYFTPMARQLDDGGRAAMLHDLLAMPLGDWHPRWNIPQTDALAMQKAEGLLGFEAFAFDLLSTDDWPADRVRQARWVSTRMLHEEAQKWLRGKAGHNHFTLNKIADVMVGVLGCTKHRISGGPHGFLLQDTATMRERWNTSRFPWSWRPILTPSEPLDDDDQRSPF